MRHGDTEAQRGERPCPGSPSWPRAGVEYSPPDRRLVSSLDHTYVAHSSCVGSSPESVWGQGGLGADCDHRMHAWVPRVLTVPLPGGDLHMPAQPTHFAHLPTVLVKARERKRWRHTRFVLRNCFMLLEGLARPEPAGRADCGGSRESEGWKFRRGFCAVVWGQNSFSGEPQSLLRRAEFAAGW